MISIRPRYRLLAQITLILVLRSSASAGSAQGTQANQQQSEVDFGCVFGAKTHDKEVKLAWPDGTPVSVILRSFNGYPSCLPWTLAPGEGGRVAVEPRQSNPRRMTFPTRTMKRT